MCQCFTTVCSFLRTECTKRRSSPIYIVQKALRLVFPLKTNYQLDFDVMRSPGGSCCMFDVSESLGDVEQT